MKNSTDEQATAKRVPKRKRVTERAGGRLGAWRRVNRVQLAALMGVHPDTITDYARDGMPVKTLGGRGKQGVYDAVDCLAWWRQQQGKNLKEAAQTRAYQAQAELNELKLAVQRGELWPREQVIAEGQAYTKAWAAHVRALPRRLRQQGTITTAEQEAQVAAHCRQLLSEVATWNSVADATRAAQEADARH